MLMFIRYNSSHNKLCMTEHYNSLRIYFSNDIKESFVCYIFPQAELSESYVNNRFFFLKQLTLIRSMQAALHPYARHSFQPLFLPYYCYHINQKKQELEFFQRPARLSLSKRREKKPVMNFTTLKPKKKKKGRKKEKKPS